MEAALNELLDAARTAARSSYSPYSSYPVGAAVRWSDGSLTRACNVENISFGLSLCAERNAVTAGVAAGQRQIVAVAVWVAQGGIASPCGACRQVLQEFAGDPSAVVVVLAAGELSPHQTTLAELLPNPFKADLD